MVKRCQRGLCNSGDRYPDILVGGIEFIQFPKPKRYPEKCKRWINASGRTHEQLNVNTVKDNYNILLLNILADLNSLCYRSDHHIMVHVLIVLSVTMCLIKARFICINVRELSLIHAVFYYSDSNALYCQYTCYLKVTRDILS